MDVASWLRSLGLEQYEATFRDNAIDDSVLPDLTDQDLEELGILLGHRLAQIDADQLRAAIAALPAPFLETLVLRDIEGLDYREIAQTTEVPIGSVMSRLARARRRLTAKLGGKSRE